MKAKYDQTKQAGNVNNPSHLSIACSTMSLATSVTATAAKSNERNKTSRDPVDSLSACSSLSSTKTIILDNDDDANSQQQAASPSTLVDCNNNNNNNSNNNSTKSNAMHNKNNSASTLSSSSLSSSSASQLASLMETIMRFLQLLCENHYSPLQNYLREQPASSKPQHNIVAQTLRFLDWTCGGSWTPQPPFNSNSNNNNNNNNNCMLLDVWIGEKNARLVNQSLITLIEYCQGPCRANQQAILANTATTSDATAAATTSGGLAIIVALVLSDMRPLCDTNMHMAYTLKNNACRLLLSLLECNESAANAERIFFSMRPAELVAHIAAAYELGRKVDRLLAIRQQQNSSSSSNSEQLTTTNNWDEAPSSAASSSSSSATATVVAGAFCASAIDFSSTSTDEESDAITALSLLSSSSSSIESIESLLTSSSSSSSLRSSLPLEFGHNMYILALGLSKYSKDLGALLKSTKNDAALHYYSSHTGQIEVCIYLISFSNDRRSKYLKNKNKCEYINRSFAKRTIWSG